MKALVTGGLGFVGGVVAQELGRAGHDVRILDDGRDSVADGLFADSFIWRLPIEMPDISDLIWKFEPDVVLHFAASAAVGDGENRPLEYARNNVGAFASFLITLRNARPIPIVHSGSCAVYGVPDRLPVDEDHPTRPVSWYGRTKLMAEELLVRSGLPHVLFRYFNAAGSAYGIVENRIHEERLIPKALEAVVSGSEFTVNGHTLATKDGTCVRDYVHVLDLADAHMQAAVRLAAGDRTLLGKPVNLGTGRGASVLEVLTVVERVTGGKVQRRLGPGRPGDISEAVASCARAKALLGWKASRTLEDSVRDAWEARKAARKAG